MTSYPSSQDYPIINDDDIDEIMKSLNIHKKFSLEKVTRRILVQMAQTFIQEMLDVGHDKNSLNKEVLNRQIGLKFPQLGKQQTNLECHQKRQKQIDKEDIF